MTVQQINHVIKELKELDLKSATQTHVEFILSKIRKLPFFKHIIPSDSFFTRARPLNEGENFSTNEDLRYLPQWKNGKFQRASTPNGTMFYGVFIPNENINTESDKPRAIVACEAVDFMRNPKPQESAEATLVYGKWRTLKECKLAVILSLDETQNNNPYSIQTSQVYRNWIENKHQDYIEQTKLLIDFFANEYSKFVPEDEHFNYKISGIFSEKILKEGYVDGIIYPSVKTDGIGLCVAIKPDFVNENMILEKVLQCKVTKEKTHTNITNEKCAKANPTDQSFILKDIEELNENGEI